MKKNIINLIGFFIIGACFIRMPSAAAGEVSSTLLGNNDDNQDIFTQLKKQGSNHQGVSQPKKSLTSSAFVVETDEASASQSLDRISGQIDMGFAGPESTYKSVDHYGVGPFAKEKAEMSKNNTVSD